MDMTDMNDDFQDELDSLAPLAELAASPAPAALRDGVLAAALRRRPAGFAKDGAVPCDPIDAYERTATDMAGLLGSLTDAEWDLAAPGPYGRVRDMVAHLVGVERLCLSWIGVAPAVDPEWAMDHVAATRPAIDELATADTETLIRTWTDLAAAVAAAGRSASPDLPVVAHDLPTDLSGLFILRTFEVWAHAVDIAGAVGRPLPVLDGERLAVMSRRLMGALPDAVALHHLRPIPGRARMVLTGPAGGTYDIDLGGPDGAVPETTIVVSTLDLCMAAARRAGRSDFDVVVEGDDDLADLVLAGVGAFAKD